MTDRIEYEFDNAKFMADLRDACGKSLSDIETRTVISKSAWSRIDNGKILDMETFMQACARCELQPGDYFKRVRWQRVE